MMDFLNCKICEVPYDEDEQRPRNSPCGHELCSSCIRALIKEGIFECPKCRQKNIVNSPDDLPICFGLIDVIRAFNTQNIAMPNKIEPKISETTNDEFCKVHQKPIVHRCLSCQMWLCIECLDAHPTVMGCSTIEASNAVSSMKENQSQSIKMLLNDYEEDENSVTSKIQMHDYKIQESTDKRENYSKMAVKQREEIMEKAENLKKGVLEKAEKEGKEIMEKAEKQERDIMEKDEKQRDDLSEKAKKHGEEAEKLHKMVEKGNFHKEKLIESEKYLRSTSSPYALMDKIEELTHREQLLSSYSVKSLGTESLIYLRKVLKKGKDVYVEMEIKSEKIQCRLSQQEGKKYLHVFRAQKVPDSCICAPVERMKKLINFDSSLVFLELSLGGVEKGRVLLRLDRNLPNIRGNFVNILTGKLGKFLAGMKCDYHGNDAIGITKLPFREMAVTPDSSAKSDAREGDVVGRYTNGHLDEIRFQVATSGYASSFKVLGSIVSGLAIIQECYNNPSLGVTIMDCGMVL